MKLNAFGDVCLRSLMLLGSRPDEQLTGREVAESIGVPYNHVSKAILELRRRGALDVTRGRNGGARITPAGLALTVGGLLVEDGVQPRAGRCSRASSAGRACCRTASRCSSTRTICGSRS